MHRTLPAAALTVLAVSLSGCGSDDDATAAKAISDSIIKSGSESKFLSMKRKDADCIGDGLVDEIGREKLQKYGLLTKDMKAKEGINKVTMSAADAERATDVLFGCTDVEAMTESAINTGGKVPKRIQACVSKTMTKDSLRPMFVEIFQGKGDSATKAMTKPITACVIGGG